jgi:hypothetical protein
MKTKGKKKATQDKVKIILWDFLMDCLKIHHFQEKRQFETIPEAQNYYSKEIMKEIK